MARIKGVNNLHKRGWNRLSLFTQLTKLFGLLLIVNVLAGCVGLDRALNPITNHTQHYAFNYQDISRGGILVAAVVDRYGEIDI